MLFSSKKIRDNDKTKHQLIKELKICCKKIAEYEKKYPQKTNHKKTELNTVSVPDDFHSIFLNAQDYVNQYFKEKTHNPKKGYIGYSDERYILVRAASMSKEFFDMMANLYKDIGEKEARILSFNFLFDIAHSIGKADAKSFFSKMDVTDPIKKLSAGPIYFAYTGWASVKIDSRFNPTPDENYYLLYDHPYSFEANAWIKDNKKTDFPVCAMNAGYSSGWCEESFGVSLVTVEIECRAKGDEHYRFIMAPPSKIKQYIKKFSKNDDIKQIDFGKINIPEFFKRKRLEDELIKSEKTVRALLNAPQDKALLLDTKGGILDLNKTVANGFGKNINELIGKNIYDLFPEDIAKRRKKYHDRVVKYGKSYRYEDERDSLWMDTTVDPIFDASGNVERVAVFSRDMIEYKTLEN